MGDRYLLDEVLMTDFRQLAIVGYCWKMLLN